MPEKNIYNILGYSINEASTSDWTLSDLVARYGVNPTKITKDFFGYGLPHYKHGNMYHFRPSDVMEWEKRQKYVPYGRRGHIVLPAYLEFKKQLKADIRKAKSLRNKKEVAALREIAKEYEIDVCTHTDVILIPIFIFIALISIFLYLNLKHF